MALGRSSSKNVFVCPVEYELARSSEPKNRSGCVMTTDRKQLAKSSYGSKGICNGVWKRWGTILALWVDIGSNQAHGFYMCRGRWRGISWSTIPMKMIPEKKISPLRRARSRSINQV